jgi:REP element-mobilizing transposase RayT
MTPAHVTLRVMNDVPSLRSSRRFAVIRRCFAAAKGLHGLRMAEFTVMGNHLHLIVEAETSGALTRGMQGLCIMPHIILATSRWIGSAHRIRNFGRCWNSPGPGRCGLAGEMESRALPQGD